MFTRMIGALFAARACYAVYNTREAAMKWSGMGEFKALHSLIEIARLNADIVQVNGAVLLGRSEEVALKTLLESDKSRRMEPVSWNPLICFPMAFTGSGLKTPTPTGRDVRFPAPSLPILLGDTDS